MIKQQLDIPRDRKLKLADKINHLKQMLDNSTTQKDIQKLYENIQNECPHILDSISLFKHNLLRSDRESFTKYNHRLLNRVFSNFYKQNPV